MDVSERAIGKAGFRELFDIERQVFGISAVAEQNANAPVFRGFHTLEEIVSNFPCVVGKAVDFRVQAAEVDRAQGRLGEIVDIFRPGKREHRGDIANAIVIAGDDGDRHIRNRGEQVADFFEIAHKRLMMEEISRNQEEIRFFIARSPNNRSKRIFDSLRSLRAPRFSDVRLHAVMEIACVDKLHDLAPC